jgi:hypothetical protein
MSGGGGDGRSKSLFFDGVKSIHSLFLCFPSAHTLCVVEGWFLRVNSRGLRVIFTVSKFLSSLPRFASSRANNSTIQPFIKIK